VVKDFLAVWSSAIRAIRGIRGRLAPYNWCASPQQTPATGAGWGGLSIAFSFFFENFAPPFPEKEVRDGNIQKKESKNNY
jgi:hypothetical protein